MYIGEDGRVHEGDPIECVSGHKVKGRRAYIPPTAPTHDCNGSADTLLREIVEEKRKQAEEEKQRFDKLVKDLEVIISNFDHKYLQRTLKNVGKSVYIMDASFLVRTSNLSENAKKVLNKRVETCSKIPYSDNLRIELGKEKVSYSEHETILDVLIKLNRLLANCYESSSIVKNEPVDTVYRTTSQRKKSTTKTYKHQIESTDDRILDYLKKHPNRLAKEIADALNMDRHEVNSCIYRKMLHLLKQDSLYRWKIK